MLLWISQENFMSGKFFKVICAAILSIGLAGQSNAGIIYFQEGEIYSDGKDLWEYVGYFDLKNDDSKDDKALNGLEAAMEIFSVAGDKVEDFALSAFWEDKNEYGVITEDEINNEKMYDAQDSLLFADVNHKAWYDSYSSSPGLKIELEDTLANVNGDANDAYEQGDFSAYVSDRAAQGFNINYVFKRTTQLPEPSTLAIFSLALLCLGARRFKR